MHKIKGKRDIKWHKRIQGCENGVKRNKKKDFNNIKEY